MEHTITALKVQKRNPQRVNVYLDGEFAFGVARIVAAWLEIGRQISDEKIAQLKDEDGREVAYQIALRFLSYRPRTAAEIRTQLEKKGISENDCEFVLERLKNSGLIDDARFADMWVENRTDLRPRGRRALAYELRRRGVSDKHIQQSLEDIDEDEIAYQAACKQFRKYRSLEWDDFRKKMYAHLARRGFSYATSAEATARVWAEQRDGVSGREANLGNPTTDNEEVNDEW